ncbi:MAG: cytochrome c-type biogenesis protein CcmH [Candidatus Binatia bacterium]|nr:cytochrome c-type biogenesis protein CcmH [Candidatus Binatia bacterium]
MRLVVLNVFLVGQVAALATEPQRAANFQEIEESLTCQCGCGLTVHSCNHVDCGSAIPLRQEIREQIALGKTKREILAYFEAKYGEKILSSPTMRGFNLLAWLMPFLAVGFGLLFVGWTLRRWSRNSGGRRDTASNGFTGKPLASEDEKRLRQELDRLEL